MFVALQPARNPESPTRKYNLELWVENVGGISHMLLCLSNDGLLIDALEKLS